MTVPIHEAQASDARECGRIINAAFAAIADQHNFPRDFPSAEVASDLASMLIAHPRFYGIVAEEGGRIVGGNFLDERSPIGGVGPITGRSFGPEQRNRTSIDASGHSARVGTENARYQTGAGRFHTRSLCLYTRLEFATRELLSVLPRASR